MLAKRSRVEEASIQALLVEPALAGLKTGSLPSATPCSSCTTTSRYISQGRGQARLEDEQIGLMGPTQRAGSVSNDRVPLVSWAILIGLPFGEVLHPNLSGDRLFGFSNMEDIVGHKHRQFYTEPRDWEPFHKDLERIQFMKSFLSGVLAHPGRMAHHLKNLLRAIQVDRGFSYSMLRKISRSARN